MIEDFFEIMINEFDQNESNTLKYFFKNPTFTRFFQRQLKYNCILVKQQRTIWLKTFIDDRIFKKKICQQVKKVCKNVRLNTKSFCKKMFCDLTSLCD